MLRRANDDETAAFLLVERTIRRTRPRLRARGLRSANHPEGSVERGALGRLRFRFDGRDSDLEPENRMETRSLSAEETSWWNDLERMVHVAKPVADSEWNLVSMRIGPRVLSRLPMGSVVTFLPDGTPPFKLSAGRALPKVRPQPALRRPTEAELLFAIDAFLLEADRPAFGEPPLMAPWSPGTSEVRAANRGVVSPLYRSHKHPRGKWQKCPICHTPVVKGLFNPRIAFGTARPGTGKIHDLRGGYLSRLRETYLLTETNSLVASGPSNSK